MLIYIDEAGSFSGYGREKAISTVGSLIIPGFCHAHLMQTYSQIRPYLPKDKGEVKGRLLSEKHIDLVARLLQRYPVIFECSAIDLLVHDPEKVREHQRQQVQGIIRNVSDAKYETMRQDIIALGEQVGSTSLQLYVQAVVMFDVVKRSLEDGCLYYVQRKPQELGAFDWIIDAKGRNALPTPWEKWWSLVVMMAIEARSIREPHPHLIGADYSYFERFDFKGKKRHPGQDEGEEVEGTDLRKVLGERLRFASEPEPGLELVDVLTTAMRRALVGNLGEEGWRRIPSLMIQRPYHFFSMLSLQGEMVSTAPTRYERVLDAFSRGGKVMVKDA